METEQSSLEFTCPQCGATPAVTQVQGDRCPGCHFEFKWFGPGEARLAEDYHHVLTRRKHLLALPEGQGFIVAHE
jgi:primosomal protein N'